MLPAAVQPTPPPLHMWRDHSVVRMGDEGIPINAIARTLKHPSGEVREKLKAAIEDGRLLNMPRDDWPPGSQRDERLPDCIRIGANEPTFIAKIMTTFRLTNNEARLFAVLLRRPEASKTSCQNAMQREDRDETEIKIVDVTICKIRAKFDRGLHPELTPAKEKIITIWGWGYRLLPEVRQFVMNTLGLSDKLWLSDDPGSCRTETAVTDGS